MVEYLHTLPHWLLGLLVCGGVLLAVLVLYTVFHSLVHEEFSADDKALSLAAMACVATVTSLLLAFSAVSVWESFGAAEEAVRGEADTIGKLARNLSVFGSPESEAARGLLRRYGSVVVEHEWNVMSQPGGLDLGWAALNTTYRAVGRIEPDTPRRQVLLSEIWARTNELIEYRRSRIHASQSKVPWTLWAVVMVGTVLTMATTFVLPPSRVNVAMISSMALAFGLVFFFIIALDRPFGGYESIDAGPIRSALENMHRWDDER